MAKAMLMDLSKCTGCRGCQIACKQWNDLEGEKTKQKGTYQNPPDISSGTWKLVFFNEAEIDNNTKWLFLPKQCFHCKDASCVSVCPTKAAHHVGEVVVIDQSLCIGCGYCGSACPFGVPHLEATGKHKETARKCTFCIDRLSNGLPPACAKTCPAGVYTFGERKEVLDTAHKRLEVLKSNGHPRARLYGEKELGGMHVMMILLESPSYYGLPESPRYATSTVLGQWLSGFVTAGIVAVLPFWLLFKRKQALSEKKSKGGEK